MSAWNSQRGLPAASSRDVQPSYVLVAGAHVERTVECLESIKPFNVDVRVARDGEEALEILRRAGPPALLIADLSLSRQDGFAVIEALRSIDGGRAEIIAWSPLREIREFAAQRLAGLNVRVLGGEPAPAILRRAIERALRPSSVGDTSSAFPPALSADDIYQTMTELSEKARQLCGTAGVAVYWKAAGETRFRASVTWTSETPIPHSPYHLPRVFDRILETGEALVFPDLATQPSSDVSTSSVQDVVRGLVAVPIVSGDQQVVGTICVFDLEPLTVGSEVVDALKALGRQAAIGGPPAAPDSETHEELQPGPAPVASQPDEISELRPVDRSAAPLDRRDGTLAIARELARVRREQRPLSVVLFAVSPLDRTTGDLAPGSTPDMFATVGETLTKAIRASDLAIRWTRDELLAVLAGLGLAEARQVAERVRAAMQAGASYRVAVSGGVAELHPEESFESAVARANEKVQLARARGHNRVA